MGVTKSSTWAELLRCCDTMEEVLALRGEIGGSKPKADKPSGRGNQSERKEAYAAETKPSQSCNEVPPPISYDGPSRCPNRPPHNYSFKDDEVESMLELLLK